MKCDICNEELEFGEFIRCNKCLEIGINKSLADIRAGRFKTTEQILKELDTIVTFYIKTTGFDADKNQVLEIAAVMDNGEADVIDCKIIHCYVVNEKIVGVGDKDIIDRIDNRFAGKFVPAAEVAEYFNSQLPNDYTIAIISHSIPFLKKLGISLGSEVLDTREWGYGGDCAEEAMSVIRFLRSVK